MEKVKKNKIINQVKANRAAARLVEIELQTPKIHPHIAYTSKKDLAAKVKNTVKVWEKC